jgi:hypothetical protein
LHSVSHPTESRTSRNVVAWGSAIAAASPSLRAWRVSARGEAPRVARLRAWRVSRATCQTMSNVGSPTCQTTSNVSGGYSPFVRQPGCLTPASENPSDRTVRHNLSLTDKSDTVCPTLSAMSAWTRAVRVRRSDRSDSQTPVCPTVAPERSDSSGEGSKSEILRFRGSPLAPPLFFGAVERPCNRL